MAGAAWPVCLHERVVVTFTYALVWIFQMPATRLRLSSEAWLRAGFRALITDGPDALRAEPLAREIGTTKGSFYWHFKDVAAFRKALLEHWKTAALTALRAAAEAEATPTERLYRISQIAAPEDDAHGGAGVEAAIRSWALSDHTVADALAEIDSARLAYLTSALDALGLGNPDFAPLVYGAQVGLTAIGAIGHVDMQGAMTTLIAALVALMEA